MEQIFERAFAANEKIKDTAPEEYEIVKKRLTTESLYYRFLIISNYSGYYPNEEVEKMINSFENDARMSNLTGVGREVQNNPSSKDLLENVIASWRSILV